MTTDPRHLALLRDLAILRKAVAAVERRVLELVEPRGTPPEEWRNDIMKKFERVI